MTDKRSDTGPSGRGRESDTPSAERVVPVRRGETITGQRVVLDDVRLENCILVDCDIIYGGGETSTEFTTKGCIWHLEGAAQRTLYFLRKFNFGGIAHDKHLGKGK